MRRRKDPPRWGLSDQLREIIVSRGLTAYALGKAAGLAPTVVQRFLNREHSLTLTSADRIAAALGVRLAEVSTRRARPRPELPVAGVAGDVGDGRVVADQAPIADAGG